MAVAFLIMVCGLVLVASASRTMSAEVRRLVLIAFLLHVLSVAAQVWMHTDYYGGGDMVTYNRNGLPFTRLLRLSFTDYFPQIVRLMLHMDTNLPYVHGQGGSSGTMVGLASLLVYVFNEPQPLWQECMLVATWAMFGQLWVCRAAFEMLDDKDNEPAVASAILLVPSVIFWTSALVKEAIAFPFLAMLLTASVAVVRGRPFRGVVLFVIGALGVGLVKGYLLMPFVLSLAGAALVARQPRGAGKRGGLRIAYIVAGLLVAVVGLAAFSVAFPEFSPMSLAETTARYQQTYERLDIEGQGGSNIDLSDEVIDVSLTGQLKLVPLAIVNALFRPAVFEARSAVQLAAGVETLVVTILIVRLLRHGPRSLMKNIGQSPALMYCAIFVMTFGIAVGLSTLNLGTLSRYRVPMMPFFFVLLLVLGRAAAVAREAAEKAALRPERLGSASARALKSLKSKRRPA